jgi:hypothetical protein
MAEAKKSHGGGGNEGLVLGLIFIFAIVAVIIFGLGKPFEPANLNIEYVFAGVGRFVQSIFFFFTDYSVGTSIKLFVGFLSAFLLGLSFYLFLRIREMEIEHANHVFHLADELERKQNQSGYGNIISDQTPEPSFIDKVMFRDDADLMVKVPENAPSANDDMVKEGTYKWQMVIKHSSSSNPSDWKLAIIEADTILDALVENSGFPGSTLGERLKNADPGVFRSLEWAKEAHGVRNKIAHQGSGFRIDAREAKRVIQLYEEVFKEFEYI